jgi:hypothetical protein
MPLSVAQTYSHYLLLRGPGWVAGPRSARAWSVPSRRPCGHDLLQPDDLHLAQPLRGCRRGGRPCPGPGGGAIHDEAQSTEKDDCIRVMKRLQWIVRKHGKRMMGWAEIGQAELLPGTLAQHWSPTPAPSQAPSRPAVPSRRVPGSSCHRPPRLSRHEYDPRTPLGRSWAGYVEARDAYEWDPAYTDRRTGRGARDRRGVGTLARDPRGHRGRRVHRLLAPAWDRRDRLVAARGPRMERISVPARRPGPAVGDGAGELLPLAAGALALTQTPFH